MNRDEKAVTLDAYKELFDGVEAVIVTCTAGVGVNAISGLRSKFRAEGVTFKVVKNTLARLALKGTELEPLAEQLKGPVAVALKKGDPVSPARIAIEFAKDNPKFQIKCGFLSGKVLDANGVETLSKMKGKNELRADLLSIFKAPQTKFVGLANTMVTQFLGVLNARKDKLEKDAA